MPDGRQRVIIENLQPQVDCGRFPAKRAVGELVRFRADVFTDGHDQIRVLLAWRYADEPATAPHDSAQDSAQDSGWRELLMQPLGNDRWAADLLLEHRRDLVFTVVAWVDHFGSWLEALQKKQLAGQDVGVELRDGVALIRAAAQRARESRVAGADAEAASLDGFADGIAAAGTSARMPEEMAATGQAAAGLAAADPLLVALMNRHGDRSQASRIEPPLRLKVDPRLAACSAWYELFPRSLGPEGRHGTFADLRAILPRLAAAGFDVVYLPPIHPIGASFRKGPNNTPAAGPDDVGSPWAIGGSEGGHKAVHPELGTLEEFEALVVEAREMGLEIALDIAFQCSPDHPYVREHPEWFRHRADGTIQYAENPPKKYQDVYPFNFECADWRGLWQELKSVFEFWIARGVKVFRVDNPHTKPLPFWEWCLGELIRAHPETVYLSEAFTRPRIMYRLAKVGFSQSYTYFTWRNSKPELTEYMRELVEQAPRNYFRPNFWPNTPDILPEYLQYGGRPAHLIRLVLAATLSSNYGIYGPALELSEGAAVPGSEEYLNSEKYELRKRDLDGPGTLYPFCARLNAIRRAHPALQQTWNIRFLPADNDFVLFFAKWPAGDDPDTATILVAVNLDPHNTQSAWLHLPEDLLGIEDRQTYMVHDLLGDDKFVWQGPANAMSFDPRVLPARIFTLKKRLKRETDFDYFM